MPTEPQFAEIQLPSELSEVEGLLQQFSPTDSAINRDALMYQAGWAAAQVPIKTHWLWPTTSGVLAAALLLLITLPTASPLQRTGTEPINSAPFLPAQAIAKKSSPSVEPDVFRDSPAPLKRYSPKASLLAMRDRALRQEFDDLPIVVLAKEGPATVMTTSRDLLEEFLPSVRNKKAPARQRKPWWQRFNLGETS